MFGLTRLNPALRMLISRRNVKIAQSVRQGSSGEVWRYRDVNTDHSSRVVFLNTAFMTFFWWWVFTHFWYQSDHVTGHWDVPDPSKWTDEELGIPSDDAE